MPATAFLVGRAFVWSGLSRRGLEVIPSKGLDLSVGTVMVIAATFLLADLVVNVLAPIISPRIRLGEGRARAWARPVGRLGRVPVKPRGRLGPRGPLLAATLLASWVTPCPERVGSIGDLHAGGREAGAAHRLAGWWAGVRADALAWPPHP